MLEQEIVAGAAEPGEVVRELVLERALGRDLVLHRGRHEEAVVAPVEVGADDAVDRARAEGEIVPVHAGGKLGVVLAAVLDPGAALGVVLLELLGEEVRVAGREL